MKSNAYEENGIFVPMDGIYSFFTQWKNGETFHFTEQFIDKLPTGKFGAPPNPFGEVKSWYLTA